MEQLKEQGTETLDLIFFRSIIQYHDLNKHKEIEFVNNEPSEEPNSIASRWGHETSAEILNDAEDLKREAIQYNNSKM